MALQISDALRSGIDTLLSEDGLLITGVFLLFNLGNTVASSTFTQALFDDVIDMGGPAGPGGSAGAGAPGFSMADFTGPFSLDVAVPVAIAMVLLLLVIGQLIKFWGIRLFAEPQEIMDENTSERAVMAVALGGGVAVLTFAASMSSTALNVSGRPLLGGLAGLVSGLLSLIVGLAFVYLLQSIALYDGGYVDTLTHSVARFMDAPAQIIVLLFILFLLGIIPAIPTMASVVSMVLPGAFDLPSQSILQVTSMVLNAPVKAFSLAVITDAYLQVRTDQDADGF
jgi:hypothetical protein